MKKLLLFFILLALVGICTKLKAQTLIDYPNYSKKDAIISASTIGMTFLTLEFRGSQMTYGQRSITAFSGIAISAGYSLFQTTKIGKKIKHRIYLRRKKSINENNIGTRYLCEIN